MTGFTLIALFVFVISIAQLTRSYFRSKSVFYLVHLAMVITLISFSILLSMNQSGGVNWPWWIFALMYTMPVLLSLIIGIIQDIVKRTY
jgi:hypothetical protein